MVKTQSNSRKKTLKNTTSLARTFYRNCLCDCSGNVHESSIIKYSVPQKGEKLQKTHNSVSSSKEFYDDDLQDLMQMLSSKNGAGAKVDVDAEGNLVWKKPRVLDSSYSMGVGRIGRIDENESCSFNEMDAHKKMIRRSYSLDAKKIPIYQK